MTGIAGEVDDIKKIWHGLLLRSKCTKFMIMKHWEENHKLETFGL